MAILFLVAIVSLMVNEAIAAADFETNKEISIVSREDGSGTRGAYIELFGIEARGVDGSRKDLTSKEAVIAKQTDVMMTNIAGDRYAIGYISLGSLNKTIKAVAINGVTANIRNVQNGSYVIARPFYLATKGAPSGPAKDFIDFILSSDGQAVVVKSYVTINDKATAYKLNSVCPLLQNASVQFEFDRDVHPTGNLFMSF